MLAGERLVSLFVVLLLRFQNGELSKHVFVLILGMESSCSRVLVVLVTVLIVDDLHAEDRRFDVYTRQAGDFYSRKVSGSFPDLTILPSINAIQPWVENFPLPTWMTLETTIC